MSDTTKMSAMDRISNLLDENSFVEIGAMVTKRNTDYNLKEKSVPEDGVITGYGTISNNLVYVFSQDATALGGSIGEMHARKIARLYELAVKVGAPVIGLVDCAGLRLQEATDALAGFGDLYLHQTLASGVILQIKAVFGSCGGGAAILASLSDFTLIEKNHGKIFVNSPNALDGNYTEKCNTASAEFQGANGMVDYIGEDGEAVLAKIRELVEILPNNNEDEVFFDECNDDNNRLTPAFFEETKDVKSALIDISDNHFFLEIKEAYAKDMVTGFIKLNGMTIGAVANRTEIIDENGQIIETYDGKLSTQGCEKAIDFIRICDAYNIPILSLTNVLGFKASMEEEKTIGRAAAKLAYLFANATVPKINVIVGKAFGSAYITMNSKHIGADIVFALPQAQIGMMDANAAVKIIYADELSKSDYSQEFIKEKVEEINQLQGSAEAAAKRGYVDSIIKPNAARKQLIFAFEMLFTKRESRYPKKHGTV